MSKLLSKASFTEICKIVKNDHYSELGQCMFDLFGTALLFFPGLMCREAATLTKICDFLGDGLNLAGAAEQVKKAAGSVARVFGQKKEEDFSQRYDRMQIAHVLIVYAAYFDSMALYLPDEMGQIALSEKEKYVLTKEAVAKYCEELKQNVERSAGEILQKEILPPDPVMGLDKYEEELELFYAALNREFAVFFGKLSVLEETEEHKREKVAAVLAGLPQKARENYWKQYYELAALFPDFRVWASQQQHRGMEKRIDVGFAQMHELLEHYEERKAERRATDTFEKCLTSYQIYVEQPVISQDERTADFTEQIVFPQKKEIFIPQSFRVLNYEPGDHLENEEAWEMLPVQEDIAQFVRGKLLHPSAGKAPLVILGHPGAGKTLLCHMLAAQSLCGEFHTLIIRLRDIDAEQTIMQQINWQIEQELGGGCSWNDITNANLSKPVLFVFDGYDELLQASGRTYANYLSRIAEFQQQQGRIHGMMIRCIVTSRISLIDKAVIPEGSTILRLNEFDDERIALWSGIWNKTNEAYFFGPEHSAFVLEKDSSVYELGKQPLLLLMLALYDSGNNALKRQKDMSLTQLYENLIEEFVIREKRKEKQFLDSEEQSRQEQVEFELSRIGVTALGMYNRRALFIRGEELNQDLRFFQNEKGDASAHSGTVLSDSESLLGSFFFIHKSESAAGDRHGESDCNGTFHAGRQQAYEFLHNTFGEFLAARFILEQIHGVVSRILMFQKMNQPVGWQYVLTEQYHAVLMYASLFKRPLVLSMIGGYFQHFFERKGIAQVELERALELLMEKELPDILSGEKIIELKKTVDGKENPYAPMELMEHLAIYSMNLLLLRTILAGTRYELKLTKYGQEDLWERFLCIWKYAFSQEDLLSLGEVFQAWRAEEGYVLQYTIMPQAVVSWVYRDTANQLSRTYLAHETLGDSMMMALTGTLLGDAEEYGRVSAAVKETGLNLEYQHMWNTYLKNIWNSNVSDEEKLDLLEGMGKACRIAQNMNTVYQYYMLLCTLVELDMLPCAGEEREQVLQKQTSEGFAFLRREGWILFGSGELDAAIQTLLLRLMDHYTVSSRQFHQLLHSSIGRENVRVGIAYHMHRNLMMNYLRKAVQLAGQVKYRKYVKQIDREEISEMPRCVWANGRYDKFTREYLPDALALCEQMVRYGNREDGLHMMAMLLEPLPRNGKCGSSRMNIRLRSKLADSLVWLQRYEELQLQEIIVLRQTYVGQIKAKGLLEISQEALQNYCYLLNLEEKPELSEAFVSDLKWILKRKREELTTGLVKEMERLLEKRYSALNSTTASETPPA